MANPTTIVRFLIFLCCELFVANAQPAQYFEDEYWTGTWEGEPGQCATELNTWHEASSAMCWVRLVSDPPGNLANYNQETQVCRTFHCDALFPDGTDDHYTAIAIQRVQLPQYYEGEYWTNGQCGTELNTWHEESLEMCWDRLVNDPPGNSANYNQETQVCRTFHCDAVTPDGTDDRYTAIAIQRDFCQTAPNKPALDKYSERKTCYNASIDLRALYIGPFVKIWSDCQCPPLRNYHDKSLAECEELCLKTANCTAINFSEDDCFLRGCPTPIPPPELNYHPHQGYAIGAGTKQCENSRKCIRKNGECLSKINWESCNGKLKKKWCDGKQCACCYPQ